MPKKVNVIILSPKNNEVITLSSSLPIAGESTISTKYSADKFWYVTKIRAIAKDKPWEK